MQLSSFNIKEIFLRVFEFNYCYFVFTRDPKHRRWHAAFQVQRSWGFWIYSLHYNFQTALKFCNPKFMVSSNIFESRLLLVVRNLELQELRCHSYIHIFGYWRNWGVKLLKLVLWIVLVALTNWLWYWFVQFPRSNGDISDSTAATPWSCKLEILLFVRYSISPHFNTSFNKNVSQFGLCTVSDRRYFNYHF